MKSASGRLILMTLLVCTFIIQTSLVYLDGSGYKTPPLSAKAQDGWTLWHENNCQSCHQIYGFGGFLGPDLTNAIQHLAKERLQTILTVGMPPMPAFQFSSHQIEAISTFLSEVDETGTGQFRFVVTPPNAEIFDQIVDKISGKHTMSAQAETGYQLVRSRKCIGCHLPNLLSTKRAPDLCNVIATPGAEGIAATLQNGRIGRGMPPFELSADEQTAVISFLTWMYENQTKVRLEFKSIVAQDIDNARIPWFEYDK